MASNNCPTYTGKACGLADVESGKAYPLSMTEVKPGCWTASSNLYRPIEMCRKVTGEMQGASIGDILRVVTVYSPKDDCVVCTSVYNETDNRFFGKDDVFAFGSTEPCDDPTAPTKLTRNCVTIPSTNDIGVETREFTLPDNAECYNETFCYSPPPKSGDNPNSVLVDGEEKYLDGLSVISGGKDAGEGNCIDAFTVVIPEDSPAKYQIDYFTRTAK